ncbi:hypothetical protein EG68_11508 [Paragonimus skrjabini miyazakii]|uniref:Uncharacterized protein n=1 Tax=Paragonimus skrjabini miyazakii TaxID=59628 RepID=A0A8S9YDY6_9TREM|nr:hypothetical protein EG68_11508 [Paragonimus skrjabini miyazakii]
MRAVHQSTNLLDALDGTLPGTLPPPAISPCGSGGAEIRESLESTRRQQESSRRYGSSSTTPLDDHNALHISSLFVLIVFSIFAFLVKLVFRFLSEPT